MTRAVTWWRGARLGHVEYKLIPQQPMLVSFSVTVVPDPLTAMLEAARAFEKAQDTSSQESIPLSSLTEEEFVERFGA